MAQMVKNMPEMQETRVRSLSWEDPLEKRKAAAAAAKSLQSCPTLCDPIDGYPLQYSYLERRLEGYSPWSRKELDTTERLSLHFRET